jgi:hypothetical protein
MPARSRFQSPDPVCDYSVGQSAIEADDKPNESADALDRDAVFAWLVFAACVPC